MKLDPGNIYGYESNPKCLELLIAGMIGRFENDKIPPVKVQTFNHGQSYELLHQDKYISSIEDGGHHRLLAAYLMGEKLDATIVNNDLIAYTCASQVHPSQMTIESNFETYNYEVNINKKEYRSLPDLETYKSKYIKVHNSLKFGTENEIFNDFKYYENIMKKI